MNKIFSHSVIVTLLMVTCIAGCYKPQPDHPPTNPHDELPSKPDPKPDPKPNLPSKVSGTIQTGDDCDEIDYVIEYGATDLNSIDVVLKPGYKITWWKAIGIPLTSNRHQVISIKDGSTSRVTIDASANDPSNEFTFYKAKFLGRETLLGYTWRQPSRPLGGARVTFTWRRDSCN